MRAEPTFLNRGAELALLGSLLHERKSVLVSGPEGIGKSALRGLQKAATELYYKYGGESRRLPLDRVLDAELSSLWEILEDCRPRAMKGYGPMDEEAARELEADMLGLIETVLAVRSLLLAAARR